MEWYCGLSLLCLSKNMGAFQKILGLVDALGLFLVTRHPFVELFLLLMRTGDNLPEQSGSIPENFVDTVFRREYFMIYLHSVVYFICGTGMTLDMKRRQCGFAAGVHVAVVTAMTLHGSPKMTEYSMARLIVRAMAVLGGYLFVAGGLADSIRGHAKVSIFLQRAREMLAVYLLLNAYMLWQSPEDQMAYIKSFPGSRLMLILIGSIYVICGLCIFGGYEAGYFGRLVSWLVLVTTVFVDGNTKYWLSGSSHVGFWMQIQFACRNLPVVGALLLLGRKRYW